VLVPQGIVQCGGRWFAARLSSSPPFGRMAGKPSCRRCRWGPARRSQP